jgi:hypothetical protein
VIATDGPGLLFTTTVAVVLQLLLSVTETVYVPGMRDDAVSFVLPPGVQK